MKIADLFNSDGGKVGELHTEEYYGSSSFSWSLLLIVVIIGGTFYGAFWKPAYAEWQAAQTFKEQCFWIETYVPIVLVPVVSLVNAAIHSRRRDSVATFWLTAIVLFLLFAVIGGIHQYGIFDIWTGMKYLFSVWFVVYLLALGLCGVGMIVKKLNDW